MTGSRREHPADTPGDIRADTRAATTATTATTAPRQEAATATTAI